MPSPELVCSIPALNARHPNIAVRGLAVDDSNFVRIDWKRRVRYSPQHLFHQTLQA